METITSKHNGRVKFLCKLKDRNKRDRYQMFLIEGFRELSRALENKPAQIEAIFFCENFFRHDDQKKILELGEDLGIELCNLSAEVFEKISNRENCDGIIGLAKFWVTELSNINKHSLILVAESIEKSGNLGALMRSAESAGVDGLILCDAVTDIFNQNVIRASQGAVFSLPIAVVSNAQCLEFLRKNNCTIFVTTPYANNFYFKENFQPSSAIVVGSEHKGLSNFWLTNKKAKQISLPQMGVCDSLNVNDAAVVILYEVLRQRLDNDQ